MKLTTQTLKKLIKEELEGLLQEESKESKDMKMNVLLDFMFNKKTFTQNKKALNQLSYYLGQPDSNVEKKKFIQSSMRQVKTSNFPGHDLQDPRTVSEIVMVHQEIEKNPQTFYAGLKDHIDTNAQNPKIVHKKAQQLFGDTDTGDYDYSKKRSFLQKAGSFLTGKGFKE